MLFSKQTRASNNRTTKPWWVMLWLVLFVGLGSYSKALMLSHELGAASAKTYVVFGQVVKICAPTQNKANQNTANTSNQHCDACVLAFIHSLDGAPTKFDFGKSKARLLSVSSDQVLAAFELFYHSRAPPKTLII